MTDLARVAFAEVLARFNKGKHYPIDLAGHRPIAIQVQEGYSRTKNPKQTWGNGLSGSRIFLSRDPRASELLERPEYCWQECSALPGSTICEGSIGGLGTGKKGEWMVFDGAVSDVHGEGGELGFTFAVWRVEEGVVLAHWCRPLEELGALIGVTFPKRETWKRIAFDE